MFLEPGDERYRPSLLNAVVAPRPIGWISTVDGAGRPNLAPFSYFNSVTQTPPMVMFVANQPGDRTEKDTLANVRIVPEFVANFATFELREAVNASSAPAPQGTDEFGICGLEALPSRLVQPPRVASAPAHLECRVRQIVDLAPEGPGERHAAVVIGRVVGVHLDDALVDAQGRFDTVGAHPITRMGGFSYSTIGEVFDLVRPDWPLEKS